MAQVRTKPDLLKDIQDISKLASHYKFKESLSIAEAVYEKLQSHKEENA